MKCSYYRHPIGAPRHFRSQPEVLAGDGMLAPPFDCCASFYAQCLPCCLLCSHQLEIRPPVIRAFFVPSENQVAARARKTLLQVRRRLAAKEALCVPVVAHDIVINV